MASASQLNLCSVCNKSSSRCFCVGCEKYFCSKDFKEHEQQLSMKFDNEIVRSHDELLDEIQKFTQSNDLSSDLFAQIEQWKKQTIQNVENAAKRAHRELIEVIDKRRIAIVKGLEVITDEIRSRREEDNFVETDIDRLRIQINELQQKLRSLTRKGTNNNMILVHNEIDWNGMIRIKDVQPQVYQPVLNENAKWSPNGVVVTGGNGRGDQLNQLHFPYGLCVDDDQTVYVADSHNHRIVEWKCGATVGRVVAGGNGPGTNMNQLDSPLDVIINKTIDCLIISDSGNRRVVRWPRQNGKEGEVIISNVGCFGLAIDDYGNIYVADESDHAVRRFRVGDSTGTIVAGGNGPGNNLNQLNEPRYIFVDRNNSLFISDTWNHRVMKWVQDAKEGTIVAGGKDKGKSLAQLSGPDGIFVDASSTVYVADFSNDRIVRWRSGALEGDVIIGGNIQENGRPNLCRPFGLCFDRQRNIYNCDSKTWVLHYKTVVIVIVPSLVYCVINAFIFMLVHSSSRRVHCQSSSTSQTSSTTFNPPPRISRRDIHLLRHMVFVFSLFIGGWGPAYVIWILRRTIIIDPILINMTILLAEISLLSISVDLFMYNHELRRYLKSKILQVF